MKQNRRHIKPLLAVFTAASFAMAGCGTGPDAAEMGSKVDEQIEQLNEDLNDDWEESRAELTEDLRELKADIEKHIVAMEKRLEDKTLTKTEREALETKRIEYKEQASRIDRATSDLGMATRKTWNDVKTATKNTAKDIGDWFSRQAENVDKKTDADNDQDGH